MYSSNRLIDRCRLNNSIMQRAKPPLPIISTRTHVPIKDRYGWADTLDLIEYNRAEYTHLPLNLIGSSDRVILSDKGVFYRAVTTVPEGRRERYALY